MTALHTSAVEKRLQEGLAVAVRVESERHHTTHVMSGVVGATDEESPWIAYIEPSQLWTLDADNVVDASDILEELDVGPPRDVRRGERDSYNTTPGLCPTTDGEEVELLVPDAVFNGSGVLYYMSQTYGTVIAIETGPVVDANRLIEPCIELAGRGGIWPHRRVERDGHGRRPHPSNVEIERELFERAEKQRQGIE